MAEKQGEKENPKKQSWLKGFAVAFAGLKIVFCNERNFRFHLLASLIVIALGFFFHVTTTEWLILLLLIALVLSIEAMNTAVEYICDYISPEYHIMIKKIKDVAAGAVLLTAIIAVVIGCIIFLPYVGEVLN